MCDCERGLELISARLDGVLSEGESAELEAHLAACEDCRAVADDLASLHAVMPALVEEVPEGFHSRVMERIAAEKVVAFPVKKTSGRWKSWASMAAVFAVILLGAGGLNRLGGMQGPEVAPMSAAHTGAEGAGSAADVPQGSTFAVAQDGVKPTADPASQPTAENKKNTQPANTGSALPTAAPTPAPEATPAPQMQVRTLMDVPPQAAGAAVAAEVYPAAEVAERLSAVGDYDGWDATLDDGTAVTLRYLGVTGNGGYYEFALYVLPSDEEQSRFAVSLDGAAVEERAALGAEAYAALTGGQE